MDTLNLLLLILGIAFILAELILPGGIVIWLGISSIIIVLFRHYGFVQGYSSVFAAWAGLSATLVLISATVLQKFMGGETEKNRFNEDEQAIGSLVKVEKIVTESNDEGRINYQGTAWKARSESETFNVGETVVITGRENITWLVKEAEAAESTEEN